MGSASTCTSPTRWRAIKTLRPWRMKSKRRQLLKVKGPARQRQGHIFKSWFWRYENLSLQFVSLEALVVRLLWQIDIKLMVILYAEELWAWTCACKVRGLLKHQTAPSHRHRTDIPGWGSRDPRCELNIPGSRQKGNTEEQNGTKLQVEDFTKILENFQGILRIFWGMLETIWKLVTFKNYQKYVIIFSVISLHIIYILYTIIARA